MTGPAAEVLSRNVDRCPGIGGIALAVHRVVVLHVARVVALKCPDLTTGRAALWRVVAEPHRQIRATFPLHLDLCWQRAGTGLGEARSGEGDQGLGSLLDVLGVPPEAGLDDRDSVQSDQVFDLAI